MVLLEHELVDLLGLRALLKGLYPNMPTIFLKPVAIFWQMSCFNCGLFVLLNDSLVN